MINYVENGVYLANMHAACRTQCSEDALRSHLQMAVKRTYELARQRDELERLCNYHEKIHADLLEQLAEAPRWLDVVDELPQEAQEVLFVRGGKVVHGAWIGGIFWYSNQKMAAAKWMPLPQPPKVGAGGTATLGHNA
jgi:hypothetical protein